MQKKGSLVMVLDMVIEPLFKVSAWTGTEQES